MRNPADGAMRRDSEANRFSARAARYARVGANVGGVAARIAGARLFGREAATRRNAAALAAGARRPEGADHEGRPAHGHHSGRAAARIRRRSCRSSRARRRRWARPSSSGACRPSSAPDWQARFGSFELDPAAAASLGQVHRADRHGRRAARLQAAISGHAVGRGGGSRAARDRCSPSTGAWTRPSTPARSPRRSASGCARSSTIAREAKHAALYATMLADVAAGARAAGRGRSSRPAGC